MIGVHQDFEGEVRIHLALDDVVAEGVNLKRADEKYHAHYSAAVKRNLDTEGGNVGGWEPLSDGYAEWKAKHFPRSLIEQREGNLYRSLTERDAEGAVYDVSETEARFGSSLPYARSQNEARPLIALTDEDVQGFIHIFKSVTVEVAREKGFQTETQVYV
jgi:hypothetical protein